MKKGDTFLLGLYILPALTFLAAIAAESTIGRIESPLLVNALVTTSLISLGTPLFSMIVLIHKGPEWVLARPILKWLIVLSFGLGLLELYFVIRIFATPFLYLFENPYLGYLISFSAFIPILIIWWRVTRPLWRSVFSSPKENP